MVLPSMKLMARSSHLLMVKESWVVCEGSRMDQSGHACVSDCLTNWSIILTLETIGMDMFCSRGRMENNEVLVLRLDC